MCFIGLNIDWGSQAETILKRGDNDEYWRKDTYRNEASQYYFHIWKAHGALGNEPSYPKFQFYEWEEDIGCCQINKVHMEVRLYKSVANFVEPSSVGYSNVNWHDEGGYYRLYSSWREKTKDIRALNGDGALGDFMFVSDSIFAVSDFEPLDKGIELVFGDKASVGLICSFADSLQEGKGIPGRCCLDAPYQTSAPWGQPYSCDDQCVNDGPTLGGLDEGACNAYGGTFCRNPSSCDVLQECVEEYTQAAIDQELNSYQQFLEDSPEITDPTSFRECGNAREYFGYDKDFLDDERVCDDVWQMRMTEDFDFLDEFYNQGSDGGVDGSCGTFAECHLTPPEKEDDFADVIKKGKKWRSTNFGLEQLAFAAAMVLEYLGFLSCPEDPPLNVAKNACTAGKNLALSIAFPFFVAFELIHAISDRCYGEKAEVGNVEPIATYENSVPVYDNMVSTVQTEKAELFKSIISYNLFISFVCRLHR